MTVQNRVPDSVLHGDAEPRGQRRKRDLQRLRLQRPRRHDRQIRMGPRRQRQLRDQHRRHGDCEHGLRHPGQPHGRPAGDRQQRRHGDHKRCSDRSESRSHGVLHRDAQPGRPVNATVSFNGSASKDPDGTIAKYEWDLDGNGSYETNTGATATTTKTYATIGARTIGLRVTDNIGATATTTQTVTIQNRPPTASFTVSPNPATAGATVTFNASGSTDPDGTVAKYEWDLDGNGSYETNTGATATTTRSFTDCRRPRRSACGSPTTTAPPQRRRAHSLSAAPTTRPSAPPPDLIDYWRLGEASGTDLGRQRRRTQRDRS